MVVIVVAGDFPGEKQGEKAADKRRRKTLLRATNKDDADITELGLVCWSLWILYGSGYGSAAEMRDSGTMAAIPEPKDCWAWGYKNKQSKRAAEGVIEVGVSKQ